MLVDREYRGRVNRWEAGKDVKVEMGGHPGQSYQGLLLIGKPLTENVFIKMSILDYEFATLKSKNHQLVCFFTRPYALGR